MKNILTKQIGKQVEQRGNYICFSDGSMLNICFKINKVIPSNGHIYVYYSENLTKEAYIYPSFPTVEAQDQALIELQEILTSF